MRIRALFTFILFLLHPTISLSQSSDEKIDSVLEHHFRILDGYLKDLNSDPSLRRVEIISFFENITEIQSDADGTFIGKLSFSKSNLKGWKNWIATHRKDLFWNPLTRRIEKKEMPEKETEGS